jgi:hypothetical protein
LLLDFLLLLPLVLLVVAVSLLLLEVLGEW